MEKLITQIHAATNCFKNYSVDQLSRMDDDKFKKLCVVEVAKVYETLLENEHLELKMLNKYRMQILEQRYKEKRDRRIKDLDNYFATFDSIKY